MGRRRASIALLSLLALGLWSGGPAAAQPQPDGQLTIAFDASIALRFWIPPRRRASARRSSSCMPSMTR